MNYNISNDVITMAKELFPSLFQSYSSLSDYEITKCLYECNYNRKITVNTLNHMIEEKKKRNNSINEKKKESIVDFFNAKKKDKLSYTQYEDVILPDSSDDEDVVRNVKSNPSSFLKIFTKESIDDTIKPVSNSLESKSLLSKPRVIPPSDEEDDYGNISLQNSVVDKNTPTQIETVTSINNTTVNNGDNSVISVISSDNDSVMSLEDVSSQESDLVDELDEDSEELSQLDNKDDSSEESSFDMNNNESSSNNVDNSNNISSSLNSNSTNDSSDLDDSFDELGSIIRSSLYSNPKANQKQTDDTNYVSSIQHHSDSDMEPDISQSYSYGSFDSNLARITSNVDDHSAVSIINDSTSKSFTMMNDNEYLELAHTKLPYFQSIRELELAGCPFPFKNMFKTSNQTKSVEDLCAAPPKKRQYRKRFYRKKKK